MIHANENNFEDLIKENIVLVDFFASWCGPCKMLSPIIEELANEKKEITFVKVDVNECQEIAKKYGVMSIPTLIFFKNGEIVKKNVGFMPKPLLINWLQID